jgi:hypothetical protein
MSNQDSFSVNQAGTPGDQFQRYVAGANHIQRGCCCRSWEARECYSLRYDSSRPDDIDQLAWNDDECCCTCHVELRELEEDIWGPRDE